MKPPKPKPAGQAAELPDVERHDEIFFRHASGARVGKVVSRGAHGVTVAEGAQRHKVTWDNYLGHRTRVHKEVKVIDTGEDGFLVEDPAGGRRFVRDPIGVSDVGAPQKMAKSIIILRGEALAKAIGLGAKPVPARKRRVLILGGGDLAKAIKNGAGLSLQSVTDKAGHQTKRWKKTMKDQPKGFGRHSVQDGHHVKFRAHGASGEGHIDGEPGAEGAHVRDGEGRVHQVKYSEVTHHEGKAVAPNRPDYEARQPDEPDKAYAKRVVDKTDAPAHLPEEHDRYFNMAGASVFDLDKLISTKSDEENQQGGDNGPKRMMAAYHGDLGKRDPIKVTPNGDGTYKVVDGNGTLTSAKKMGWKSLPTWVVQPVESKAEVYAGAVEATEHLREWLNKGSGVCDKLGYETQKRAPEKVPDADWDKPGGMLFVAPTKKEDRAFEKVRDDYSGDWSRLKDAARCTVAVDTIEELTPLFEHLKAAGMKIAQPIKDRYNGKPTTVGYRDMNIIIQAPNGHLTEVQINTKEMMRAKNKGHKDYEVTRTLEGRYGEAEFSDWDETDLAAYRRCMAAQVAVYGAAYKKLTGGK